ncbi:hypothetical protein PVAP13_3NG258233 [Panicum virgatum]|uniref:Uncharacterized protein n=1 Tax=Panicum virgatum TaxID=38727 RepID=A0A8T0UBU1_PANVG|nr:hypothetical protein PVAP13_3NG258233 [Panicum virgatum]
MEEKRTAANRNTFIPSVCVCVLRRGWIPSCTVAQVLWCLTPKQGSGAIQMRKNSEHTLNSEPATSHHRQQMQRRPPD